MDVKTCSTCGEVKALDCFYVKQAQCKVCRSAYQARYYAQNTDKIREGKARYYAENADKILETRARYYAENADKIRERRARYQAENADKIRECKARWRAENADEIREYIAENADKLRECRRFRVSNLTSGYVAGTLHMPIAEVPPELIDIKRQMLKSKRTSRAINRYLMEQSK